jgi:hypothetical protein
MELTELCGGLYTALGEIPFIDAHTHINEKRMSARDLADILLYHMSVSDLYAAGCPDAARIDDLSEEERERRVERAIPYLPRVRNTSIQWGVRTILKDLYGWDRELSLQNWKTLNGLVKERAADPAWPGETLKRAGICRSVTELWRGEGQNTGLFQYSLEWAFFTRSQWGQFDTALLELEHAWNQEEPGPPLPVTFDRSKFTGRKIQTMADVHAAIRHYAEKIPYDKILSAASHFSTDIAYREAAEGDMEAALARRDHAGPAERDIYANYIHETFLKELERSGHKPVLQYSLGSEPLPYESGVKMRSETVFELAELFNRHRGLEFNLFLASEHQNQAFCTLARELPNVSLSGYWWHNFFPAAIRHVFETRLDMLPACRHVGFFSDAYCTDWAYAKALIIRRQMARVFAEKIAQGQYTRETALDIARELVYETPRTLLGVRGL